MIDKRSRVHWPILLGTQVYSRKCVYDWGEEIHLWKIETLTWLKSHQNQYVSFGGSLKINLTNQVVTLQ